MSKARSVITYAIVLVVLSAQKQSAPSEAQEDIIVYGRKIIGLNIEYSLRGPFLAKCKVAPPSGNEKIDAVACGLVKMCVKRLNTIPDNVTRCLRKTLSDIKDGKSRLVIEREASNGPVNLPSAEKTSARGPADVLANRQSAPVAASPSSNTGILVVAPKQPREGLWEFSTLTSVLMSRGLPSPPPLSRRQCIEVSKTETSLERMVSLSEGGGGPGCRLRSLRFSNGKFHATRICIDTRSRSSTTIDGRYDSDSIEFRQDEERVDLRRRSEDGGDRTFVRLTTGRRIGDC